MPHKFNLKRNLFYLIQTSSGSYISKESYSSMDFQKAGIICLFVTLKRNTKNCIYCVYPSSELICLPRTHHPGSPETAEDWSASCPRWTGRGSPPSSSPCRGRSSPRPSSPWSRAWSGAACCSRSSQPGTHDYFTGYSIITPDIVSPGTSPGPGGRAGSIQCAVRRTAVAPAAASYWPCTVQ